MNKKYLILAILLAGLFVSFTAKAESPTVNISDFKASVSTPGTITGSFSLENKSNSSLTDVTYYLTLRGKSVSEEIDSKRINLIIQPTIAKYQSSTPFELKTDQEKNLTFSLDYPTSIKSGEYQLSLFIGNSLQPGDYSSDLRTLSLEGSNEMLFLDTCKVIDKKGREYPTFQGAPLNPGDQPTVKCEVTNPTNKPVEFTVNYQTGILHILTYGNQKIQDSQSQETYSLKAKETKEIILTLPKETEPNIYETFAQFVEKGTNNVISPYLVFRWTIKGEAARIDKVEVDPFKSNYTKGEKITVTMDYAPSPDLYWRNEDENLGTDLKGAKIILTLYDKNNKSCGQVEKTINEFSDIVIGDKIELSINSNCKTAQLLSQISKGDKVLASYTLDFPTEVPKKVKEIAYFVFSLLLIAVAIAIWFISKKRISLISKIIIIVILIVLLLYLGLLIFIQPTKAASGSLGWQTRYVTIGQENTRTLTFKAKIPSYDISDYQQGSLPSKAKANVQYESSGGCDNEDTIIFITAKIEGIAEKVITIDRYQGRDSEGYENGTEPINFLDYSQLQNAFENLAAGNYNLIIEGRAIVKHISRAAGENYSYQPAGPENGSRRMWKTCSYFGIYSNPQAIEIAEANSYIYGWKGDSSYTTCGDGINAVWTQYTYSPLVFRIPFTVNNPPIPQQTISGRVYNETTGTGFSNATINTCRGGPAVKTDANGNFSFQVPQQDSFCVRVSPQARDGFDGPFLNNNPTLEWAKTYEWQVAGWYCATQGCDWNEDWRTYGALWDRNSDTGFDFRYTATPPTAPTVDIKANGSDGPITIPYNTPASLTWTSTNTTGACTASNGWTGSRATSGSQGTGSLTSSKTYTLTCTGPGGSASDSVTVNVTPVAEKPTAGFMCTLTKPAQQTQESWKICNKDNIKPFKGQWVYLKDDPTLTEYSYTAAEGITITNREWEIVGGAVFSPNPNPPDNNNPNDNNPNNLSPVVKTPVVGEFKIRLTVTDSNGETDPVEHTLNGRLPPPDWIEIPPF